MGQNGLGQSDYRIFKSTISLEQNDEKAWKLEVDWIILGWAWWKMGVSTQDSKTGCMPRINEWYKLIFGVLIQIQRS